MLHRRLHTRRFGTTLVAALIIFGVPITLLALQNANQHAASANAQLLPVTTPINTSVTQFATPSLNSSPGQSNGTGTATSPKMKTETKVTVNGQNVPVPENGSVHTTVPASNGSGSTNIDINVNNASQGTDNSYTASGGSSSYVDVFTSSASSSFNFEQNSSTGAQ